MDPGRTKAVVVRLPLHSSGESSCLEASRAEHSESWSRYELMSGEDVLGRADFRTRAGCTLEAPRLALPPACAFWWVLSGLPVSTAR